VRKKGWLQTFEELKVLSPAPGVVSRARPISCYLDLANVVYARTNTSIRSSSLSAEVELPGEKDCSSKASH
jgi:hypothetical protein